MTDKQTEALELAELIEIHDPVYEHDVNCTKSAAELRRQYQEIQDLKKAKEELLDVLFDALSLLRDDYPRTVERMLELYTKHLKSEGL